MATKPVLSKHYQRILTQWPVDPLRPNVSFQEIMRKRIKNRFDSVPVKPEENVVANGAQATIPITPQVDEKSQLEQLNILYSFLENRYAKKYPLSERITKPASSPTYYDDLIKELQEAPNRSWFTRLMKRVKGVIRFS